MTSDEQILLDKMNGNFKKDAIFVLDQGKEYSYDLLYQYIKYYNMVFEATKVKKVLISLPQGFLAYSAVLGAFFSQVTFCTIKFDDPIERKIYYYNKFKPDIIICNQEDSYADLYSNKLLIGTEVLQICRPYCLYEAKQNHAYVMFTSGTTGMPKAVCIKRNAVCKSILWMLNRFELSENDICSQYSNMSFDMSLIDILLASTAGATLIPFPTLTEKLFPEKLIKKYEISFWHSVPTVIDILQTRGALKNSILKSVKKCKIGGDRIYINQMNTIFDILPNLQAFITYGTTEITFICTCIELNSKNYLEYGKNNIAIGYPVDGWNVDLINIQDGLGQIVVSGPNIGDGYLGNDDDKFGYIMREGHNERAFFTGDFGCYIDGCLYYSGRKDQQVKLNGNRINLTEIDAIVRGLNGCTSSLTLFLDKKIILFFTGDSLAIEDVRDLLANRFPKTYMPKRIIKLEDMPYNNSGKIDRKKLAEICGKQEKVR